METRLISRLSFVVLMTVLAACGDGVNVQGVSGVALGAAATPSTAQATASPAPVIPVDTGIDALRACLHCAP